VTPDVATLPAGQAPRLAYFDVGKRRIIDGTRRVSVGKLQGTVTHLHNVRGGYVVGRTLGASNGLAFVTNRGARSALTSDWLWPSDFGIYRGVMVSGNGKKIVFNTAARGNPTGYRDTVVMKVPSGQIVARRTFSAAPKLLGFRAGRVLMGVDLRVLWWTPRHTHTSTLADGVDTMSADLTARQYVRRQGSEFLVASIPPRQTPAWPIAQEDWELGYWSPDDKAIAGTGEVPDGTAETQVFLVQRAATGASLLTVLVPGVPQMVWENNSTLLIMTRVDDESPRRYQLIRCTLSGSCSRVGGVSSTKYGPYVLADRRNS
jgi:hypothetical protein